MQNLWKSKHYLKALADVFLLAVSFLFAVMLAKRHMLIKATFFNLSKREILLLLILGLVWYLSAKFTGLYDEFRCRTFGFELITVFQNSLIQVITSVAVLFVLKTLVLSRYFIFIYFLSQLVLIGSWKMLLRMVLSWMQKRGRNLCLVLIVGAGEVGKNFSRMLEYNPHLGYRVKGFIDDRVQNDLGDLYLGTISQLQQVLSREAVDEVVIALPNSAMAQIDRVIAMCERHPTSVRIIPDYFKFMSSRFNVFSFGNFPIISIRSNPLDVLHWRILKRVFDLVIALFLFVFVFSWLWPILALAIKLTSPGPVFFKQERWGKQNRRIICYKFRTMIKESRDVDEHGNYLQASPDDRRITRFGRFLRQTSLDELPQFINILKGEMSVVGPRPHPTPLNLESRDSIPNYMLRHLVKSGITGWAQVNGFRGETADPQLMQKRVEYDIWYIENWSFLLDLQIILLTLWRFFRGDPKAY